MPRHLWALWTICVAAWVGVSVYVLRAFHDPRSLIVGLITLVGWAVIVIVARRARD